MEKRRQRAEHRAWLAAEEAGVGDEDFIAAEVAGAVRHEAVRAARRGADTVKVKAAVEAVYAEALQEALRDRGLDEVEPDDREPAGNDEDENE